MPFDPIKYEPPRPNREPVPRLTPAAEAIIMYLIAFIVFALLVLPFSASSFIDIVQYIAAH